MQASTRVVFNTGIQYIRTFISVCIALYTSRIILQSLGESDYGIYSLIGGVISMLSFINISLSSTTQRYLSFHQGKKDNEMQIKVFNNSIFIQLFIGVVLALIMYFLTPFIFDQVLNIPAGKIETAIIVYYTMIVSIFFTVLSAPYLATIVAHENILYSSIIQIADAVIKLIIAVSLLHVFYDKLIYYSIAMSLISIINFLAYLIYCNKKYDECKHISLKKIDFQLLKSIFVFSGWMTYSTGCIVARTQGIAVILNKFFGTVINAAFGIAQLLQGHISFISSSLLNAIRPQIIKAEGENNRPKMLRLSEIASKFSFLLLAMIVIPAVFEMETILSLWLGKVPEYAVLFSQFILITSLVDQLTIGLGYANQAIGNIKYYSLTINTIKVLTLPAAFICLKLGHSPVAVMICMLTFEFICAIFRLFLLKRTGDLVIHEFIKKVFVPEIIPIVCTILICWGCHLILPYYLLWLSFVFSIAIISLTTYFMGLCEDEKEIINQLLLKLKRKVRYYYWIKRPKRLSEKIYFSVFNKKINWENPQTLNEKIHWLKFYSDTSQWVKLADKYEVRKYIIKCGFEHLLNDLYAKYDSVDEIDISKLPPSFVLKANNGCGDTLVVKDKSKITNKEIKKYFGKITKERYGVFTAEPHYLQIPLCIIAEKLLEIDASSISSSLIDYKFFCFDGEVKSILVCFNRKGSYCDLLSYDINWNLKKDSIPPPSSYEIPKPQSLSLMLEACKVLSNGFPVVRIDFYEIAEKPVFGEMTFSSGAGFIDYYTPEFLDELGSYVTYHQSTDAP